MQVALDVVLSVAVRWGPVGSFVNGTLVARLAREDDLAYDWRRWLQLDRRVRPVLGDQLSRGQAAKAARQLGSDLVVVRTERWSAELPRRHMSC